MAKKSAVERNRKRRRLAARDEAKRKAFKEIANDRDLPMEERFNARLKLAKMPRNGAAVRIRNRCEISGRPRGYYRKFRISRIALRELAAFGLIPGMVKSSW